MLKRKHPFTITHDSEPLLKIRILQQELSHSVESGIALLNVSSKKRKREEETEFTMSCNGTKGSGDGPGKRMKSPEISVSENKPVKNGNPSASDMGAGDAIYNVWRAPSLPPKDDDSMITDVAPVGQEFNSYQYWKTSLPAVDLSAIK